MAPLNNLGMDMPMSANTTKKTFLSQLSMLVSVNIMSIFILKKKGVGTDVYRFVTPLCTWILGNNYD